jgi:hypothetical protein
MNRELSSSENSSDFERKVEKIKKDIMKEAKTLKSLQVLEKFDLKEPS